MGGLCCPLRPAERRRGLVATPVARDIKVAIVNPANPVTGVSVAQLRALHQGRIQSWAALGWRDKPIAVIFRVHCLDRREPVRTFLGIDARLANLAKRAIKVRTDKQLIDYVARFPTAIGITSRVFIEGEPVRALALDGVTPTVAEAASGRYPFTAVLSIVTVGEPRDGPRRFLEFVKGPEGRRIVGRRFVPIP